MRCQGANERLGEREETHLLARMEAAEEAGEERVLLMLALQAGSQTMVNVARGANARGFLVVLKAAPVPSELRTVEEVLSARCVDLLMVNECVPTIPCKLYLVIIPYAALGDHTDLLMVNECVAANHTMHTYLT